MDRSEIHESLRPSKAGCRVAGVYRRGKTYWIRFRSDGLHIRRSARTSNKAEAVQFLERLLKEDGAQRRGDQPQHTYEDASERFLREASIRPKTRACYATSDRMCRPVLAGRHLHEIDRRRLAELVSRRKQAGTSDTTIRRDLAYLSSMCASAISWGWLDTNPVTQFNKRGLKEARPRTRFLSRAEYDRLLAAASAHLRRAIVLAVETGLRRGELFGLAVARIDLKRREIVLDQTKSGTPRRVPISPGATEIIREILADQDRPKGAEYLFTRHDGTRFVDFKKGFSAACRRARIEGMRWHDLRHRFASWFVQSSGDLYHLSRLLGHASVQQSARYGHLRTHDLHLALEQVTQKRTHDRLIDPPPGE